MKISSYDQLNAIQLDALKEIGTIGSGNAATALSGVISKKVRISVPKVSILDFNTALNILGGPENIVAGIMVKMSGDLNGIMLYLQEMDFINVALDSVLHETISSYDQLNELSQSALVEIGNIMISTYMNALSSLAGLEVSLSVPAMCINMAGGILSVPMVELGYETDKIMMLDGSFSCDGQEVSSKLLMMPDFKSLNYMLDRLGVGNIE